MNRSDEPDVLAPTRRWIVPLGAATPALWFELVRALGPIAPAALPTAMMITLMSLLNLPGQIDYRLRRRRRVRATPIAHPPLIILGHWRSGTTFMHELIARDPRFAFVSMWHALSPTTFDFAPWRRRLFARLIPETRPMDNMSLGFDRPFEEGSAMATLSAYSNYHCFHFPRSADDVFRRAVMMDGLNDGERAAMTRAYYEFVQAVSRDQQGRPLVLKDPAHTARIPWILQMFPGAKFVHLMRDPYTVYASTLQMRTRVLSHLSLQYASRADLRRQVIEQYALVMRRYLDTRAMIPAANLIELRFEDFEADPIGSARQIYAKFNYADFDAARPHLQSYLDEQADYRKSDYDLDDAMRQELREKWGFVFEAFGY